MTSSSAVGSITPKPWNDAQDAWQHACKLHEELNDLVRRFYEITWDERDEQAARGLAEWATTHVRTMAASGVELRSAMHYRRFGQGKVRSYLAPSTTTAPDVRVTAPSVNMAIEEKYCRSDRPGDVDDLIRDAHRQLALPRSDGTTGTATWRIVIHVENEHNPWPYTSTKIPVIQPSRFELRVTASGRNLRHSKGKANLETQVVAETKQFGTFQFAI
jgi:hypothetical protein